MDKEIVNRGYGFIGRIMRRYKSFVERSTSGAVMQREDISYWRERLFTKFITYLLPTCLIALVPGVFMAFKGGFLFIAYADMIAVCAIAAVALNPRLGLHFRKVFVVTVLYLLSIALIVDLSLLGPGIVYLLALSVLVTVIFPRDHGYSTVLANLLICIFCALIIHFKLFSSPLGKDYEVDTWIAVSSNIVFLSLVMVIFIGNTIKGFEKVIAAELLSKEELKEEIRKGDKCNALLTESESHYRSLFFQNPSPMWVLDKITLRFLQVNESATAQYGYSKEEFLSMRISDVKMEEDMQALHQDLRKNETTGSPVRLITQHRRKNQQKFYAEVAFNSILFNGRPATLVISQDVTEQMDYIQEIKQQNEKFREIAWIQSHKVRAPLATILGLTQLFNEKEMDVSTDEIIQGIRTSSRQLDEVIREIVDKSYVIEKQALPDNLVSRAVKPEVLSGRP